MSRGVFSLVLSLGRSPEPAMRSPVRSGLSAREPTEVSPLSPYRRSQIVSPPAESLAAAPSRPMKRRAVAGVDRAAGHGRDRDVRRGVVRHVASRDEAAVREGKKRLRLRHPRRPRPVGPALAVETNDRAVPGEHGHAAVAGRYDRPSDLRPVGDEAVPEDGAVRGEADNPGARRPARVAPVLRGDREPPVGELDQVIGAVVLPGVDRPRPFRCAVGR